MWPWEEHTTNDDFECERCGSSGNWKSHVGYRDAQYHGYIKLCRGCLIEECENPQVWRPHLFENGFRYFYGCASGASRKALTRMEESFIMLNYQTSNNAPLTERYDAPDDWEPILFIDSGGSPQSFDGHYEDVDRDDFFEYVEQYADLWTLWDFPCEQSLLDKFDRTVEDHQQLTTDRHIELLNKAEDHNISGQPVSVVQGQDLDEYLAHLDELRDHGVLTDYVAIGSVCAREKVEEIRHLILNVREALPARCKFHAYGVKKPTLKSEAVMDALDSADSCSYDYNLRKRSEASQNEIRYIWEAVTDEYLSFRKDIGQIIRDYHSERDYGSGEPHDDHPNGERKLFNEATDQEQANLTAYGDGGGTPADRRLADGEAVVSGDD